MPTIRFLPSEKTFTISPGTGLLEVAGKAGLQIDSPCGANGTCGRCVVKVVEGEVVSESSAVLSPDAYEMGYRQACRTRISNTDLVVEIPPPIHKKGQFAASARDFEKLDPTLLPGKWQISPLVETIELTVAPPQSDDGLSDLDRFHLCLGSRFPDYSFSHPMDILRLLPVVLRENDGNVVLTFYKNQDTVTILDLRTAPTTGKNLGIAVDLGTTTVALHLVALDSGEILATANDYNRQLRCGVDIISRINYARTSERLDELRSLAVKSINSLIEKTLRQTGHQRGRIVDVSISGNTTMVHLLLGIPPEHIRLSPYTPALMQAPLFNARDIGIDIHRNAPVAFADAVGSYVGGDITAGLLCTALATDSEEISLFIDIGTNGELAIGNSDFIMTCACSAGPAFEGGGIKYGVRAVEGAIESVTIDPETGEPAPVTIAGKKPVGICGSGMISLLAQLFKTGWIDSAGKLERERRSPAIVVDGRQAYYRLAGSEENSGNDGIIISESELENIIRAKAAIYSACTLMLNQLGIGFEEISHFYIAGGFGHFLNLEDAITIGLLPDIKRDVFRYIGNTSLTGTYMMLVSREHREKHRSLSGKMTYMDLSSDSTYMEHYTAALFLPHTDLSLFPGVRSKGVESGLSGSL